VSILSQKTLEELQQQQEPSIRLPSYDRNQLQTGIVHIGPSNFFLGHFATFIDDLIEQDPEKYSQYGICAVSLMGSSRRDILQGQDFLCTVTE
jgi:fructuronate reductase